MDLKELKALQNLTLKTINLACMMIKKNLKKA